MRIVVVVATVLEIPSNVNVPPGGPPIYPTSSPPEQPEQAWTTAPLVSTLLDDSASGVVSLGPTDQVPAEMERIQFTSSSYSSLVDKQFWEAGRGYKCSSGSRYGERQPDIGRSCQVS